jgi:hypothetical protein
MNKWNWIREWILQCCARIVTQSFISLKMSATSAASVNWLGYRHAGHAEADKWKKRNKDIRKANTDEFGPAR